MENVWKLIDAGGYVVTEAMEIDGKGVLVRVIGDKSGFNEYSITSSITYVPDVKLEYCDMSSNGLNYYKIVPI